MSLFHKLSTALSKIDMTTFPNLNIANHLRAKKIILAGILFLSALVFILSVRGDFPQAQGFLKQLPLTRHLVLEREQIAARAKLQTLNYYIPSFDYLTAVITDPTKKIDSQHLHGYSGYVDYYEQIILTFPSMAEGYALLGFLAHTEGKSTAAIALFSKAKELDPYFFWYSYNLGLLHLKNHHYDAAITTWSAATQLPPEATLKQIRASKIYQQILLTPHFEYNPTARLQQSYLDVYQLLQVIQKAPPPVRAQILEAAADKFTLRIF
jgi:tetratricopeptide (TPR) repeat protein